MSILFVNGVNDRSIIGVDIDERGHLQYLMDGNCSIYGRLPLKPGVAQDYTLFGKGVRQRGLTFRDKPRLIFNQISEPDTHRGSLERCIELCNQVGARVINHPKRILETTRDRVAVALQGIDRVTMPRCSRFQPASPEDVFAEASRLGLEFPIIVRMCGVHHGRRMVRCNGLEDCANLHALPFDGRDFYLIKYHEFRSSDGFFHKERIAVIDGKPMLRHSLYTDQWVVHSEAREFMKARENWDEETRRFNHVNEDLLPGLRPAFREMADRLGLEYFGVDGHIDENGQLLVFEANANMNVLTSANAPIRYRIDAIKKEICTMLSKYSGLQVI